MRIAVITRHAISNYGSFLQAYALQEILEEIGHKCELIDYIREDENYKNLEKTMLKIKPDWNSSACKRLVYLATRQPESIYAGVKFEKYRNKYLHLSRRYSCAEDLMQNPPIADCYLTGSDQVWGPIGTDAFDKHYFLAFAEDAAYKCSYAASFGKAEQRKEVEEQIQAFLKRYNRILVREESAVKRIQNLGLSADQVLDPTLLLSREFWINKTPKNPKKSKDKYILIYQLHNNKRLGKFAKELSKIEGYALVRVSPSLHQITREGKLEYCPDPFSFLKLVSEAACLITDSFHGTAFSIILNTPFIEVLPENGTETRNISILNMTGLANRILSEENYYDLFDQKIDFERVNCIIAYQRDRSITMLKDMINSAARGA